MSFVKRVKLKKYLITFQHQQCDYKVLHIYALTFFEGRVKTSKEMRKGSSFAHALRNY